MTIAYPSSPPEQEATVSPSRSWGLALTGVIGSGKTTTSKVLSSLLGWRIVSSGDVARAIDQGTARTGRMADADALDRALLPLLSPGPVILDGYPRTKRQLASLPFGFDVVMLRLDEDTAKRRADQAAAASGKENWDANARWREQFLDLESITPYASLVIDVRGKTPGAVAFAILQSDYLGPPPR